MSSPGEENPYESSDRDDRDDRPRRQPTTLEACLSAIGILAIIGLLCIVIAFGIFVGTCLR
jgi:hypothetical protein